MVRCGTYSIVARDDAAGQMGVAVQSHWFSVGSVVAWARAGVGVVATQSIAEPAYGQRALDRLQAGVGAAEALRQVLAEDEQAAYRQVAVMGVGGSAAVHTGAGCSAFAGHEVGASCSAQANLMAAPAVWPAMVETFERSGGPLARRLLEALVAGERAGGDVRGRQSAALVVVPTAGEAWERLVDLRVEDDPDPLGELARLLTVHDAYALATQGDDLVGQGRHSEAGERYTAAARLAPDNDELLFWAALAAAAAGDMQTALRHVGRAIELHAGWRELLDRLTPDIAPGAPALRAALGDIAAIRPPRFTLSGLARPIVQAPLAGGPSTVALAAAVSGAGGLGFLAAGYKPADAVRLEVAELRAVTARPFGVNLFAPPASPGDAARVEAYGQRLRAEADRYGVALGAPRSDDDEWEAKLAIVMESRVPVVSFTFGCPDAGIVDRLHDAGAAVWVTVTRPQEARDAERAGADALVVQGVEAGGHRGSFDDASPGDIGLIALLQLVRAATGLPLVATGGISTGAGVAAVLAAGAQAAALGTAFMLTPEAATSPAHRAALGGDAPTALTRAFTGRAARGIENRFMREHGPGAPSAYPEVHHLTQPVRAAARAGGDPDGFHLWAGQAYQLAREVPASELVARLHEEARAALRTAATRSQ